MPLASVDEVMVSAGASPAAFPTAIESEADSVRSGFEESLTATVMGNVPVTAGLPEMVPAAAAKVSPAGSLPEVMDHM